MNTSPRPVGARVAVLDTSFEISHPDLAPNVNAALAKSFVPGEPVTPALGATFSHGTAVAGVIAAAANGAGTVGVAPDAELVPIRVVSETRGLELSWLLSGLYYAVAVEADVVNMSFMFRARTSTCPRRIRTSASAWSR